MLKRRNDNVKTFQHLIRDADTSRGRRSTLDYRSLAVVATFVAALTHIRRTDLARKRLRRLMTPPARTSAADLILHPWLRSGLYDDERICNWRSLARPFIVCCVNG